MIYLLDTNIVSLIVRDDPAIVGRLNGVDAVDSVFIPVTVLGEVLFGMRRLPPGRRRDELQRRLDGVLAGIAVQGLPDGAAAEYARVKADTQGRGQALGENDCWIAAIARLLNATLVTRDADFSAVDGLVVADWR